MWPRVLKYRAFLAVQVLPHAYGQLTQHDVGIDPGHGVGMRQASAGAPAPQHAPRGSIRRGTSSRRPSQVADAQTSLAAAEVLVPPPPLLYPKRGDDGHPSGSASSSSRGSRTGQLPDSGAMGASTQYHTGYRGPGRGPVDFSGPIDFSGDGMGVGNDSADAHGRPPHAEDPSLLYEQITACTTCHSLERLLRMHWEDLMNAHLRCVGGRRVPGRAACGRGRDITASLVR